MNDGKWDPLDRFINENRPEAPAAKLGEYERILASMEDRSFFLRRKWVASFSATAAILLVCVVLWQPWKSDYFDAENFVSSAFSGFYEEQQNGVVGAEFAELVGYESGDSE